MIDLFILFLLVSLGLAALAQDPFIFSVLYLFLGAYVFSRWWSQKAVNALEVERIFDDHAFIGDQVEVTLSIRNTSRLPLLWVRIQELLPMEISPKGTFRRVFSFAPREQLIVSYLLEPQYRGYYTIGPFEAQSGDLFGLGNQNEIERAAEYFYVFPKIIPLKKAVLPPNSPMGNLRSQQPIFEDPNRPIGKRSYIPGDSMRRIDWKSSAAVGKLQVKQFEPSVDMQSVILLNLNESEYQTKFKTAAAELAITTAASLAYWSLEMKIVTGLMVNGLDAANSESSVETILARKGRSQLLKILEVLARAKMGTISSCHEMLQAAATQLGWGTTLTLITGMVDDRLLQDLYRLRQRGLNVVLIVCGTIPNRRSVELQSRYYGITFHHLINERDLDIWR